MLDRSTQYIFKEHEIGPDGNSSTYFCRADEHSTFLDLDKPGSLTELAELISMDHLLDQRYGALRIINKVPTNMRDIQVPHSGNPTLYEPLTQEEMWTLTETISSKRAEKSER